MALTSTDLAIDQGSDYVHEWEWLTEDDEGVRTPRDLTGWVGRMKVRERRSSTTVLTAAHTDGTSEGLLTLSAEGVVRLEFPNAASSAWEWESGRYDIELIDPDDAVTRFAEGRVLVSAEVTYGA